MVTSMRWEGQTDAFNAAFFTSMQCKKYVKILSTFGDRVLGGLGNIMIAGIPRNTTLRYIHSSENNFNSESIIIQQVQDFKIGEFAVIGINQETSLVIVDDEAGFFTQHDKNGRLIAQGGVKDEIGLRNIISQFDFVWNNASTKLGFANLDYDKYLNGNFSIALNDSTKIYSNPCPIITIDQTAEWNRILSDFQKRPQLIHDLSPRRFEEMVAELLSKEGFDVELTKETRDGGKDILAYKKEFFGETLFYVECKKWAPTNPVGVKILRELYGQINIDKVNAGIIATTSYFSPEAIALQSQHSRLLHLKDYEALVSWINKHYGATKSFFS